MHNFRIINILIYEWVKTQIVTLCPDHGPARRQ